jgi:hypothetical protein
MHQSKSISRGLTGKADGRRLERVRQANRSGRSTSPQDLEAVLKYFNKTC